MQNIYRLGFLAFVFSVLTTIGSMSLSVANAQMVAVGSSGGEVVKCGCEKSKRYNENGKVRCNVLTRYEWKNGCCTKIERYFDSKKGKIVEDETCYPDITEEECGALTQCKKHSTVTKTKKESGGR